MPTEWNMPRHADCCAGCEQPLAVGTPFRAYLYDGPEGYVRRDYCLRCTPPDDPAPLAAWQTRRSPAPAAKPAMRFDREAIYALFEQLGDTEEPRQVQLRFLLALLLWRKKVIQFERSGEWKGREVWEFRTTRTDTTHRVERPALAEAELESLSDQLESLLTGELERQAEASDAAAQQPEQADA